MEKIHFPSDREHESRPFKAMFFPDEYNSETPIFDDYTDPVYDDSYRPKNRKKIYLIES
jgi:hypothetical protein